MEARSAAAPLLADAGSAQGGAGVTADAAKWPNTIAELTVEFLSELCGAKVASFTKRDILNGGANTTTT